MANQIFGRDWEEIQAMQQKKSTKTIKANGPSPVYDFLPAGMEQEDIKKLKEFGKSGLEKKGWYGVLDRLARSGRIQWEYSEPDESC